MYSVNLSFHLSNREVTLSLRKKSTREISRLSRLNSHACAGVFPCAYNVLCSQCMYVRMFVHMSRRVFKAVSLIEYSLF